MASSIGDAMQGFGSGFQDEVEPELSDANVLRGPCPADGSSSSVVLVSAAGISGQPRASAIHYATRAATPVDICWIPTTMFAWSNRDGSFGY